MSNLGFRNRAAGIADEVLPQVEADVPQESCANSVYELGAPSGATGQVNVLATPTLIRFRNAARRGIKLTNLGANDVYVGFSAQVSSITGDLLPGGKGNFVVLPYARDIFAISPSGQMISWLEISED